MVIAKSFLLPLPLLLLAGAASGQQPDARWRLREPVTSFGGATIGDWLYVAGGHIGKRHAHSRQNLSDGFARVNLTDGRVEALPGAAPLQGLALVADGERVIRVGGMTARNDRGQPSDLHSVADVAMFDPTAGTWSALPPLPEPRSSHDAFVVDRVLYVVGGWQLAGKRRTWHATNWRLDLRQPTAWQPLAPLATPRRALALAARGADLFAFGGLLEDGETTARVERYDTARGCWVAAAELPGEGFGIAACVDGDRILVNAGDGEVFEFDGEGYAARGRWLAARYFHRMAARGGVLFAAGGETVSGHTSSLEALPLSAPLAMTSVTLQVPAIARSRQAVFARDGRLFVLGGHVPADAHEFAPEDFASAGCAIDLATFAVGDAPALPTAMQSQVPVQIDARTTLLLGGFAPHPQGERAVAGVMAFDGGAVTATGRALDRPRTQFGTAQHDGSVWLFGGLDYDAARAEPFEFPLAVVKLGAEGDAVATGFELPRPRRAHGCAELGGRVYLVGGMGPGFAAVEPCDVFDLATGKWQTIASPALPRIAPRLLYVGGRLVLVGGTIPKARATEQDRTSSAIEVYDPALDAWQTIGRLPRDSAQTHACVVGDTLVLFGIDEKDPTRAHLHLLRIGTAGPAATAAGATFTRQG